MPHDPDPRPFRHPKNVQAATPEQFEDQEARLNWFLFQRTYPALLRRLPPTARTVAFEQAVKLQTTSTLSTTGWDSIGPQPIDSFIKSTAPTTGRISAIAVSPSDHRVVLVGGATGGIWRSADGGATFAPVSDGQAELAVGAICFARSDPSVVYAGMGDAVGGYLGHGLLKSTDGGNHWTKIPDSTLPIGTTSRVLVDPNDPNRIYLGQFTMLNPAAVDLISAGGFRLSTDGGLSWSNILKSGQVQDLVMHPTMPNILYLAVTRSSETPAAGIFKSVDSGQSWALIFDPQFNPATEIKLAVSAADPDLLLAISVGSLNQQLAARLDYSLDQGATWNSVKQPEIDIQGCNYIALDPANTNVMYVGTRDTYKTTNGGYTWRNLTKNWKSARGGGFEYEPDFATSHTDQHVIAFSPNGKTIFIGNDGGLSRTDNGGDSFQSLNGGLGLAQLNSITAHPTNPDILYAGTQDNGALVSSAGTVIWEEFVTGDSPGCVCDPRDPSIVIVGYIFGILNRFKNDGLIDDGTITTNGTFGEPDNSPRIAFYPPITTDETRKRIYFGSWRLFMSVNSGDNWTVVGNGQDLTKGAGTLDVLTQIAIAPSDGNVLYTGSAQGRAMVTRNRGATWTDISNGLPNRFIKDICVSDTNPDVAYLSVSGLGTGHVFKTTDAGATWSDISGNLVDIPVNALFLDEAKNRLYVGTDVGVFRSPTQASNWTGINRGLPPAIIVGFTRKANGSILAATFGRGAYQLHET